ncbi:hypothetical protein FJ250_00335, partial [bacterium]|nr:hypothetical protein [bacterium]
MGKAAWSSYDRRRRARNAGAPCPDRNHVNSANAMPAFVPPARRRRPVALAVIALAAALLAPAAGLAVTWPFVHYTEANGTPTGGVMGIAQDDSGRVWFATRSGMVRYDGATWVTHDVRHGLPVAWHRDVVVDHTGAVWALAQMAPVRVSRLRGQRWEALPPWPEVEDGAEMFELVAGRDADGGVALAVLARRGRIGVWSRDRWWNVDVPPPTGTIHSLAWRGSELLIATAGGLLRLPDPGRSDAGVPLPLSGMPEGPAYAVVADPLTGALHAAGRGWFGELTPNGLTRHPGADSLRVFDPDFGVEAGLDALGGLYLGTTRMLQYLHPLLGLESPTEGSGLVSAGVSDIMVDHEGTVWIGDYRGVSKLPSRLLRSYGTADGLLKEEVSAVLQRRDGSIVLGHEGGVTFLGPRTATLPLLVTGRDWSRVTDLYEDPSGALWAAMDRGGLALIEPGGRPRWFGDADGLIGPVYAVLHDADGELWAATVRGLFRRQGPRFAPVHVFERAPGLQPVVRRLHVAGDGSLLLATTTEGVFRLKDDQITNWRGDADSGHSSAFALFEPTVGEVWVGTTGGLCRVRNGRLEPTTAPEPVIGEAVYAITRDSRGRIWFGTGRGALVWDGRALRRYGVADGLAGAEVNRDAIACDAEGRVWIGTNRGVSVFDDRLRNPNRSGLPLWIEAIEVDGRPQSPTAVVEVAPSAH